MEKKRTVHEESPLRVLFALAVLFLSIADSGRHPHSHNCDEIISGGTVEHRTTPASPVACITPKTIPKTTDGTNTFVTDSTGTLNATGASNITDSLGSYTTPNITETIPSCLQGWAIFLICLGAVVTVFLLAGIPMMVYCILHGRQLPSQTCPRRYNRKIYTTPEETAFQLE